MSNKVPWLPSLIAALCWGAMFPIAATALHHVDAVSMNLVRYLLAGSAFLALLVAVEGRGALSYDGRFWRVAALGTAGFAGFNVLMNVGLTHTTPQSASLMVATTPLLTVLVRWALQGLTPTRAQLGWAGLAFFGVALVLTDGDPSALVGAGALGDLLVLAGAVLWVRYTLGAAEVGGWSPLRYTALSAVTGAGALAVVAVVALATGAITWPDGGAWADAGPQMAYVVVFGAFVAVLAWNAGVQRLGPADASLFMNLVPVVAFAIAVARGATLGVVEGIGVLVALGALVGANLAARRAAVGSAPIVPSGRLATVR